MNIQNEEKNKKTFLVPDMGLEMFPLFAPEYKNSNMWVIGYCTFLCQFECASMFDGACEAL